MTRRASACPVNAYDGPDGALYVVTWRARAAHHLRQLRGCAGGSRARSSCRSTGPHLARRAGECERRRRRSFNASRAARAGLESSQRLGARHRARCSSSAAASGAVAALEQPPNPERIRSDACTRCGRSKDGEADACRRHGIADRSSRRCAPPIRLSEPFLRDGFSLSPRDPAGQPRLQPAATG